jgi:transposase
MLMPVMNLRQIAEAKAMRARGLTWRQIANHFGLSSSQIRHHTGALKARLPSLDRAARGRPRTGRKPPPKPGTPEYERARELHRKRQKEHRIRIRDTIGISYPLYREILTSAVEHAALTDTPIDEVRLQFGVPTLRQLRKIQQKLNLPTPQDAMAAIAQRKASR